VSRVVWTPQAIADVEAIRDYISRDSRRYATLVVDRIVESVGRLEAFPLSGRVVPEKNDDMLRELLWGNYRIVYRVAEEVTEVLTVFQGARLLGSR
jgi:addiction module RelE/StbE family toxin